MSEHPVVDPYEDRIVDLAIDDELPDPEHLSTAVEPGTDRDAEHDRRNQQQAAWIRATVTRLRSARRRNTELKP